MVEEGHGCVGNGFSIVCGSRARRGEGEREGGGGGRDSTDGRLWLATVAGPMVVLSV